MLLATLLACVNPPPPQDVAAHPVVVAPIAAGVGAMPVDVAPPPAAPVAGLGEVLPDFSLMDRNPKSPGNGQPVSPKDYVGSAAGFYFTHAT